MALRGGRYEMLQTIASGGMATVHLARALGAGGFERLVAIKVMHPHIATEPEFVSMFLDEARLAAQIRHPNAVGTIDVQQDEEGIFLVMEYVEGPSLHLIIRTLRKRQVELPLSVILRIFMDALAGLHAAHELIDANGEPLNLVHRDVSPQNILVGIDGVSRITDFGVARAESRLSNTKSGQVKGKAGYIAPEQLRSLPLDRRTDVYAAGVLLWELLANERLIQGESDILMLSKILAARHPHPREVNPLAPEALDNVAMRAIQFEASERFDTAAELADAVELAALEDGIEIASPRGVASFVRELNVHVAPIDLTPISIVSAVQSSPRTVREAAPSPIRSRAKPPPLPPSLPPPLPPPSLSPTSAPDTLASAAPPLPPPAPPPVSPPVPPPPNSETALVLSTRPDFLARRSHRGLVFGVGAGAVLTSVIWFFASHGGQPERLSPSGQAHSSSIAGPSQAAIAPAPRSVASVVASAAASLKAAEQADAMAMAAKDLKASKDVKEAKEMKDVKKDAMKPLLEAPAASQAPVFRPTDL